MWWMQWEQTLSENKDLQIYTSGATQYFEISRKLSDSESAAGLLSTFEEKDELVNPSVIGIPF